MIPFVVLDPENPTEIVNLANIVRVCDMPNDAIAVHFTNGKITTYTGREAQIIKGTCHMARAVYEQAIMQTLDPKQIVTPAGPNGRIM